MTNYTVLQENCLMQFETVQAQAAFLWASHLPDTGGSLQLAEKFAHEVERLTLFLLPHIEDHSLLVFILRRHAHWRFPNTKSAWCDHG